MIQKITIPTTIARLISVVHLLQMKSGRRSF